MLDSYNNSSLRTHVFRANCFKFIDKTIFDVSQRYKRKNAVSVILARKFNASLPG